MAKESVITRLVEKKLGPVVGHGIRRAPRVAGEKKVVAAFSLPPEQIRWLTETAWDQHVTTSVLLSLLIEASLRPGERS